MKATPAPPVFDLCGPLPRGTTVLEASAGTGKTFTIAGLTARYIAEGHARMEELMLVTFGRAATAELRDRVRSRLVEVAAALEHPAAAATAEDPLLRHLAGDGDAAVAERRARLVAAVANFDAATIATTHGFSHQMLVGMGVAADLDQHLTFTEDTGALLEEVVTDLYAADHAAPGSPPPAFEPRIGRIVAGKAVADPAARLQPADLDPRDPDQAEAAARHSFAVRARAAHAERKRMAGLLDFDDLLQFLRDALADPVTGSDARRRVRERYKVVLVDEFQDTDPVQWEILRRAFHGHTTMVLIGDPKQAIYAFRGGDIETYLLATRGAHQETLGTNWRSDGPLVDALGHLWDGVALGHADIVVRPVAAGVRQRSLEGPQTGPPLRIRVLPRVGVAQNRAMTVGPARALIAADIAADIVRLLNSGTAVLPRRKEKRPVTPGDVAVLVATHRDARHVQAALREVNVPVVLSGTSSVFLTPSAEQWLTLLAALAQPARPGLVRAAALTPFLGWDATALATAGEGELDDLALLVRDWSARLAERGVAALTEQIWASTPTAARVLGGTDGERHLTDLRHIGEALHAAQVSGRGGVAFLHAWLRNRIEEAGADQSQERARRLESDAAAVQVITVHGSKGLEFPIVYAPSLWDRHVGTAAETIRFHDDDGTRSLDVGRSGPEYGRHRARHLAEDEGESLRLAYVALTRARSQVVVYWAPSNNTTAAPLHRLLFGQRHPDGTLPPRAPVPGDDAAWSHLRGLALRSGGVIGVELVDPTGVPARWEPPAAARTELVLGRFQRPLDLAWGRLSYTGLTSAAHHGPGGPPAAQVPAPHFSEPENWGVADEPAVLPGELPALWPVPTPAAAPHPGFPSPLAAFPGGTDFGTVVHAVMEEVDFAGADLEGRLTAAATTAGADRLGIPPAQLAAALLPVLRTPLGPLAGGRTLADVTRADRLDELEFELPLSGGDRPAGQARLSGLVGLLRRHLPPGHPLAGWVDDVADLGERELRGFLTGSIDLTLRLPDRNGGRHVVVDYKTNWLGAGRAGADSLTAWDYRAGAMAAAMRRSHYPLQALLYSVALHRFLRWRLPGYRPEENLGGVLYLFVRGMCGPDTPMVDGMRCGVFEWRPPAALVTDLSDFLAGGAR